MKPRLIVGAFALLTLTGCYHKFAPGPNYVAGTLAEMEDYCKGSASAGISHSDLSVVAYGSPQFVGGVFLGAIALNELGYVGAQYSAYDKCMINSGYVRVD